VSPAPARDAGLLRRVGALMMDTVLAACAFAAVNLVLWKSGVAAALAPHPDSAVLDLWARPDAAAAAAGALALAVPLAWRALGGTPGALLLGVVLESRSGGRPGLLRACVRFVVSLALGGLGLLWSLGGRPALHDRASGTRLVVEDDVRATTPRARGPVGAP